jgi:NAD-dependent SIR2 family protein deacetylase
MPRLTKWCEANARPGYLTLKAHEYLDEDDVLRAKVHLLASMLREANSAVAYTGAGISVTAGIPDWATKHAGSSAVCLSGKELAKVAASAQPTLAHRVLTAAHFSGLLPRWIQQNHDGLPQKAGFPQQAMNEIHGAIFDPSNPIVPMQGKVRDDLHSDLLRCQRNDDLVLALGSSLCGMAADELVTVVADRARRGKALGVVIINLQQTVRDQDAALRIFAPIDRVAELLAEELQLNVTEMGKSYSPQVPLEKQLGEDIYSVQYGVDGLLLPLGCDLHTLDLSRGAKVRIAAGPCMNMLATVVGKDNEGHYRLQVQSSTDQEELLLGSGG